MPSSTHWGSVLLVLAVFLVVFPGKAAAFGAGNIPSIAQIEGLNWRHGDIEDFLKTLAFLHGKKWTSMLVSRVYFGNWLRDYSQAVDVGSLKGVNAETIRILVWVLSFLANGYATEEFEVTAERLGVYRAEEHIDNPLGYADGQDARKIDPRLRGPVDPREIEIDMRTGMKNYIANETADWATSAGYLRFSFSRSIHFGRVYTSGSAGTRGNEADLCEALRCLGQALHCMEDFSAHSNYCELALRELGYHDVFPHCGSATKIQLHGKTVYPLVTGVFGAVDFLHSVLGEATDHFTQSEVDDLDVALKNAEDSSKTGGFGASGQRSFFGLGSSSGGGSDFIGLVSKLPGIGDGFASQARDLKTSSEAQQRENERLGMGTQSRDGTNQNIVPGMSANFDPVKVAGQIYPILQFRDKIVKAISSTISKIPGLEKLIEHISETLTAFVLGLLAPFVRPIITQVSKALKDGSSGVIGANANAQLEPWRDSLCSNPTHSMLSKDHFTNILNSCAGRVATTILQYVVPRVLFAWENPGVPVDEVLNDVLRAFHHPAIRDESIQIQRDMFETVRRWSNETPHRSQLNHLLGSESVKNGKNHVLSGNKSRSGGDHHHHGSLGDSGHGTPAGSLWDQIRSRDLRALDGQDNAPLAGPPSGLPVSYQSANYGPPGMPPAAPYGQPYPAGSWAQGYPPPPQAFNAGGYQQPPYPSRDQSQPPPWGQYPPQ